MSVKATTNAKTDFEIAGSDSEDLATCELVAGHFRQHLGCLHSEASAMKNSLADTSSIQKYLIEGRYS